ncbi:MAG: YdeI/OmpD-associated family protein [Ferruginibacter sp.]|nr:YdeI/OmpD-associated family protein [Cytophagales bacterium]
MAVKTFRPGSRPEWRNWLLENHRSESSVWLIYAKVNSGIPSVRYQEAVEEALCFGWIDSKVQPVDENSYQQLFSVRKPSSVWSKVNKEKVTELIRQGLMTEAGLQSTEVAKKNGSWTILDDAERLILPAALQAAFEENPAAARYFHSLSRTTKRNVLQWIALAKRPETIQKRIRETLRTTSKGTVPKQFKAPDAALRD